MSASCSPLRLALLLAIVLGAVVVAAAEADGFGALKPGEFVVHEHEVPIDLVFIGFGTGQIDEASLREILPATYRPIVRYPSFYGLSGRDLGITYRFRYRFEHRSAAYADALFAFLEQIGVPGPPTRYQERYNQQEKNVVEVTGPVLYIDAPTVERYLAGPDGGTQRGYTIFFVNWWGRDDFRFHLYTKLDEPDPDTGHDFGSEPVRQMTAWGGTTSRTWFYDLSAGPDGWTSNWHVDDDQSEYRIPPIWEYVPGGYRSPEQLSRDLGLVTRFVGIDMLFTTSPIFDPLVTAPDVGGAKVAHVAMLEANPQRRDLGRPGLAWFDAPFMERELIRLQPYYPWKVGLSDHRPLDPEARRTIAVLGEHVDDGCWQPFGAPSAEFFCYFGPRLADYIPPYGPADHVSPVFAFDTVEVALGPWGNLLGFADDNWVDGTQTYLYLFDTPRSRAAGFGFTSTAIHEFGHHVGLSHPHDGYDSELDLEADPTGPYAFVWLGAESHSVMSYISLSHGFGRFGRDNLGRSEMAGYLNWANAVAGDVLKHADAGRASLALWLADASAADALQAFERWDYLAAAASARDAYTLTLTAARQIDAATPALDAARRRWPPGSARAPGCWRRLPD